MLKKIFSAALSVTLVLSICPCAAMADAPDSAPEPIAEISVAETTGTEAIAADATVDSTIAADATVDSTIVADATDAESIDSGTIGTCSWVIDAAGCLTIAPQDGMSGEFVMEGYTYGYSWPWYSNKEHILSVQVEPGVSASGSLRHFFDGCSSLISADISGLDTFNVTDMGYMFYNCASLISLDLSNFDTSQVTSMNYMFNGCASLSSVDLSNFNTSGVVNMSCMFENCTALVSLDLTGFDTSYVTRMSSMFNGCSSLASVDLSHFDTSGVTNMSCMFDGCASLVSFDPSNFDTSNVTYMCYMFENCASLSALDLSGWDTSSLTNTYCMFYSCTSLAYLDLSSFDTSQVENSTSMFSGCWGLRTVIVGEKFSFEEVGYLPMPIKDGDSGKWMSDNGTVYNRPSALPNNVAATYTAVFPHHMKIYAGADRYETSRLISSTVASSKTYSGVIICSGEDGTFADALCASGLSGLLDYPIVLINGSSSALDADSAAIISRLVNGAGDVIVLGGENTVSAFLASALCNYDVDGLVSRIAGTDRYATAEAVYEYGESHGGWSAEYAVVAKGNDFPDALSAASFCVANAAPMLLSDQNDASLSGYITNAAAKVSEVVIVGGTSSVSAEKGDVLKNYTNVERFGRSTRYETNLSFVRWQLNHGMSIDNAGIATGTTFPDALGSSYLLSLSDSVLLLTSKTESENSSLYSLFTDNAQSITDVSVFGGDNSVTSTTRTSIRRAIGGDWRILNG